VLLLFLPSVAALPFDEVADTGILAFFKAADSDGDGALTADEIDEKMARDFKPVRAKDIKRDISDRWEKSILGESDVNKDGLLTFAVSLHGVHMFSALNVAYFQEFQATDYHWLHIHNETSTSDEQRAIQSKSWLQHAGNAFR
jgi:hypothetical protein